MEITDSQSVICFRVRYLHTQKRIIRYQSVISILRSISRQGLLAVLLALFLPACREPFSPTPEEIPYVRLPETEYSVGCDAGSFQLEVLSNTAWTVTCPEKWVTIDPWQLRFDGDATLQIRLSANTSVSSRSAVLTFEHENGPSSLRITQAAFIPEIEISDPELVFGYRKAEKRLYVQANCTWEAVTDVGWLAIRPVTGLVGRFEMTVTAGTNPGAARTAEIVVKSEGYEFLQTIRVSQEGRSSSGGVEYIDAQGNGRGMGFLVGECIWAEVNCGFHETDYPFGQLYQWGRKSGVGYRDDHFNDISASEVQSIWTGRNEDAPAGAFFLSGEGSRFNYDWIREGSDGYWNSGTEENPVKNGTYDPCPAGWRVPTAYEFRTLMDSDGAQWTEQEGIHGYAVPATDASGVATVLFLPAGGRLNISDGKACDRGVEGYYWTGSASDGTSSYLYFHAGGYSVNGQGGRAGGCLVRCVSE